MQKKIACIIPARLDSKRFPRKVLSSFGQKPLLAWVYEAAKKVTLFSRIIFAIDSQETASIIKGFGGKYVMTSAELQSGTDRIVEVMHSGEVSADIWINWQGDEPFITEQMIDELLQSIDDEEADVWTLKKRIQNPEDIISPNVAKVAFDSKDFAMYFSRSSIPHYRDKTPEFEKVYFKHVGIYAYTTDALRKIARMSECYIEDAEKLEQLRFLYYGLKVKVHTTTQEVFGIDLPQDLKRAEMHLENLKF